MQCEQHFYIYILKTLLLYIFYLKKHPVIDFGYTRVVYISWMWYHNLVYSLMMFNYETWAVLYLIKTSSLQSNVGNQVRKWVGKILSNWTTAVVVALV